MTGAQLIAIIVGVGSGGAILELVRRRQLRDKYAALWFLLAVGMTLLAFVPGVLNWLAELLSFVEPASALFFVAILVLLGIVGHLSWETSRLENETRALSEELSLLQLEIATDPRLSEATADDRAETDQASSSSNTSRTSRDGLSRRSEGRDR